MSLTAYITATPLDSGFFKDIYSSLREFKSRFKERFELDHYMSGVVDDTDPTCEGYHKQLTMNGGEYNATNIPTTIPACPTGGIVFFSIGGELCCYDGNTAKQITELNGLTIDDDTVNIPGVCYLYSRPIYYNGVYLIIGHDASITNYRTKIYRSTNKTTWSLVFSDAGKVNSWANINGTIVIFPPSITTYYYSTDSGVNWNSASYPTSSAYYNGISAGTYFFLSNGSNTFYVSSNATTWAGKTLATGHSLAGVVYLGGDYYVLSRDTSGAYFISITSDLSTFTETDISINASELNISSDGTNIYLLGYTESSGIYTAKAYSVSSPSPSNFTPVEDCSQVIALDQIPFSGFAFQNFYFGGNFFFKYAASYIARYNISNKSFYFHTKSGWLTLGNNEIFGTSGQNVFFSDGTSYKTLE